MSSPTSFDKEKMKKFGRVVRRDTHAMVMSNLAYIGDQLGLYKYMAQSGAVSVSEMAAGVKCHPRYIREWLSAMAAAGWVEYDPETENFLLPPEHAPYLAQEDNPSFFGGVLEFAVLAAQSVPLLTESFRSGGGYHLSDQHPDIPRSIDRLNAPTYKYFLTKVWLPKLLPDVHQLLTAGAEVADVGCGLGTNLIEMASAYPQSHFSGYEPDEHSAGIARGRLEEVGLNEQVEIITKPAEEMPAAKFDFITSFDVIHDLAHPSSVIASIYRSLKSGGTYLMMELNASNDLAEMLNHPLGMMFYSISTLYCVPVSLAQGGEAIGNCMGAEIPRQLCEEAGFSNFERLDFDHPLAALYRITKD